MAEKVLSSYAMPLQMIFLEAMDVDLVRVNPRTQRPHYSIEQNHTLTFGGFLQVFKHYHICPDLLSRAQVLTLFKSLDKQHPSKMEVHDFMAALAKCALLVFSSVEWDRQYPTEEQKMRLLLLWMDKNSRLFKGNGSKLCKSVAVVTDSQVGNTPPHQLDRWLSLPHIESLDTALQTAFGYYCADDSNAITSMSFLRFLRDAGLCDNANLRLADIDVIFHQIRSAHRTTPLPQTLCFDEFYAALGVVSSRLYTSTGSSNRCFLELLNDYILPAMAHMHHSHLPLTNAHGSWRERWQQLCALKEVLASPSIRMIFDAQSTEYTSASINVVSPPLPDLAKTKQDQLQAPEPTSCQATAPFGQTVISPTDFLSSTKTSSISTALVPPTSSVLPQTLKSHSPNLHSSSSQPRATLEAQVLDELQQLSQHLRHKLQQAPPDASSSMIAEGASYTLPTSALRLTTALDRLSQELSMPPPIRRLDFPDNKVASSTAPTFPRRAKQCQPHTLHV
ncbi:hypothetical protein, variant [Aphanomyces astaci]|uniref:EF-hand domain-containing protein n=1 Tax=Aphanomyces astaci TaxID=112090 RepID=W4GZK4_APHAT|nr:hypothetical protein H257_03591 [Aphanomyces astaci]XP_009826051.1 hypothetical protein, variant [Aphanomyces astaci]ETV84358.1 hypothetical protein H257_03591 [Aphanomyces astaci]ETV84359.1 hypothetical protein, variant [Aphanomyces astaci]|eukprot:XP_009826050.1 hypothetical protein H257_03591 [Aphanomyces astaci]